MYEDTWKAASRVSSSGLKRDHAAVPDSHTCCKITRRVGRKRQPFSMLISFRYYIASVYLNVDIPYTFN